MSWTGNSVGKLFFQKSVKSAKIYAVAMGIYELVLHGKK